MRKLLAALCLFAAPAMAAKGLDSARIEQITGLKGQWTEKEGVFKGHAMGAAMGVNTWAAFAGTDDRAIVDGDFAMLEGELQDVLKALRKGGINIVAIHQHMTHEQPRMLFLHYWGVGRTEDLARALASALKKTKVA